MAQVADGHERSLKLREVVGEEATDTKVEGLSERQLGGNRNQKGALVSLTFLQCGTCLYWEKLGAARNVLLPLPVGFLLLRS